MRRDSAHIMARAHPTARRWLSIVALGLIGALTVCFAVSAIGVPPRELRQLPTSALMAAMIGVVAIILGRAHRRLGAFLPEKNTGYGPELGSTYRTANLGCGALSVRWRSCGEYDQFLRQKAWEQGPDSRSSRAGMGVLADCPPDVDQCEIVKPKQEAIKLPRLGDAEQRLRDFERWLGRQIPKHPADATRLDSFKRLLDVLAVVERIIDENPLMGRFFVTWELRTGGEFDPKRGYTKRTPKYEQAQDYGNLQGGAIIEAMGASRYITLAGAGAQSLASGMKEALEGDWDTLAGAGGYPPGLMPSYPVPTLTSGVEPFGDYNARGTAEWVGVGWEFGAGEW